MRVHVASDHAGLELKDHLFGWLKDHGHEPIDHGPYGYDGQDDYPPYCFRAGLAVVGDPGSVGVVVGGSGNGEQMAANKVDGIRAALAWSEETAALARMHNNANVVSVGARMHSTEDATRFVEVFLATDFTGEERHVRRIAMLTDYEETAALPDVPAADLGIGGQPV